MIWVKRGEVLPHAGLLRLYWAIAVASVGISAGLTVPALDNLPAEFYVWCVVFMGTIAAAEFWRVYFPQTRDLAPLGLAASLAITMLPEVDVDARLSPTAGPIVLVVAIGTVAGAHLVQSVTGVRAKWNSIIIRIISVTVAVIVFRVIAVNGITLAGWKASFDGRQWMIATLMLLVASSAVVAHILLSSLERAVWTHARTRSVLNQDISALAPLAIGVASTAVVIPFAIRALDVFAIPLFLIPLGLLRLAVVRQNRVRIAQHQTIYALSRLTEQGGLTAPGHATRVGRLSVRVGRELGLAERELVELEYAALLHDLGQVALRRPIPGGATVHTAPLDQRRIATAGASILARTAELSRLAPVVSEQATPYHRARETGHQHIASAVLRVVNAFDDLSSPHGTDLPRQTRVIQALERLRLGAGHDYDPDVIYALCRVLIRDGQLDADRLERYTGNVQTRTEPTG